MITKVIDVDHLTKRYGEFSAIEDLSFDVYQGEILGLLGPNGAGKTTTLKILTSFIPQTSGGAKIMGYDVVEDSEEVRKLIGYLPDVPPLYLEMTVKGFLCFVAEIKKVQKSLIQERLDYVIENCGLASVCARPIYKLSRGYKQRVGLAQAIIHDPQVLILDEPTVGLDPNQMVEIRSLIKNLAENRTILLSTHILSEVEVLCQKVIIINNGKMMAQDSWQNLTRGTFEKIEIEVSGNVQGAFEAIKNIQGVKHIEVKEANILIVDIDQDPNIKKRLSEEIVKSGVGLLSMSQSRMKLEDLFFQLTHEETKHV